MPVSSGLDKIHWPKEVHLADVDAAVAEDRVRHRNVEVDVRNRYLKQIILAADDLPGHPRKAHFAAFCAFVLCFPYAFGEIDSFPNASAQLFEGQRSRRRELGPGEWLPSSMAPIPILVSLKARFDKAASLARGSSGVLVWRRIATADVPAFGAAPQMEPPLASSKTLDTSCPTWNGVRVNAF